MNKIYTNLAIIILFFTLFFLPRKVIADQWIKYEKNPVIATGNGWEIHVASPTFIFDQNKLKMWYQSHNGDRWNISYAQSEDGLTWQRNSASPVLVPQNENGIGETGLVEPCVVKNDIYRMWYNSQNNGVYKIRYATSHDGINWTKYPDYVLTGQSAWESIGVANPYVIYKDGKYSMWYMGWGSGPWKIGYAESTNGINWTKYDKNPLSLPNLGHVGGQSILYKNNKFHMYYHTGDSIPINIYHVVSDDGLSWSCDNDCLVIATSSDGFDSSFIVYPEIVDFNSNLYLYYSGNNGTYWQIGLATEKPIVTQGKKPIVIIPGIFGSWNKQALVYNQTVNQSDWKMNPFIHEYDGIIQTLENIGYEKNKDYFVFNYDWRKGLNNLADDLNDYLENTQFGHDRNQTGYVNLIGHSLGGLVARIYAQKFGTDKINKLITVGSPHLGVAQVYKTVEAGEIDRFNDYVWLVNKFLLQLYRDGLKTDKQIINEKIPIARDLLPTYDFLKKENGQEISIQDMTIKNDTLLSYNPNLPNIPNFPNIFYSIVGEKGDTLFGFKVSQRTTLDKLLDFYPDGRPVANFSQIGDYTVVSASAKVGNNNKIFALGHSELIYKKESLKQIFTTLDIPYQENQIIEGTGTTISPSLFFLIFSPAEMEIIFNNNTYHENDGLIFIENALPGDYQLKIKGKDYGHYSLLIGQISDANDLWTTLSGEITSDPPASQIDQYMIEFDNVKANSPLPNNFYFDDLIKAISDLKPLNIKEINLALGEVKQAKKLSQNNHLTNLRSKLLTVYSRLLVALKKASNQSAKDKVNQLFPLWETVYGKSLKNLALDNKSINNIKKLFNNQKIIFNQLVKKDVGIKLKKLNEVNNKLNEIDDCIKSTTYYSCEAKIKLFENLIQELKLLK